MQAAPFQDLQVFPKSIDFVGPSYAEPQTTIFGLFNKNQVRRIAFKIQANCRRHVDVSQVFGFVEPRGNAAITVTCKPMDDFERSHRQNKHFTVVSCDALDFIGVDCERFWQMHATQPNKSKLDTIFIPVNFWKDGVAHQNAAQKGPVSMVTTFMGGRNKDTRMMSIYRVPAPGAQPEQLLCTAVPPYDPKVAPSHYVDKELRESDGTVIEPASTKNDTTGRPMSARPRTHASMISQMTQKSTGSGYEAISKQTHQHPKTFQPTTAPGTALPMTADGTHHLVASNRSGVKPSVVTAAPKSALPVATAQPKGATPATAVPSPTVGTSTRSQLSHSSGSAYSSRSGTSNGSTYSTNSASSKAASFAAPLPPPGTASAQKSVPLGEAAGAHANKPVAKVIGTDQNKNDSNAPPPRSVFAPVAGGSAESGYREEQSLAR